MRDCMGNDFAVGMTLMGRDKRSPTVTCVEIDNEQKVAVFKYESGRMFSLTQNQLSQSDWRTLSDDYFFSVEDNKLLEMKVVTHDKHGMLTSSLEDTVSMCLSLFFDYGEDNHHINLRKGSSRQEVINLLNLLVRLVKGRGRT